MVKFVTRSQVDKPVNGILSVWSVFMGSHEMWKAHWVCWQ